MDQDHEIHRELAALELYGELDAGERARLDAHRAQCSECRAASAELARGLGRLARAAAGEDLPAGWSERLRAGVGKAAVHGRASQSRTAFATGVAAGIAAGFAAAWLVVRPPSLPSPNSSDPGRASVEPGFGRDTPPPRAAGSGELAHLSRLRRR